MTNLPSEPLLIVGSGAMACLFAARLSSAGDEITMLAGWPEGVAALRQNGVWLADGNENERAWPVRVETDPAACAGTRFALVLVKSWQTERAARQLRECLADDGLALSLQNGLGNRETLQKHLGSDRVVLGVTTTGATLLSPGRVRPGGEGPISMEAQPRLEPVAGLLRGAGFSVESVMDVAGLLWGKLVVNAAINPLTALLEIPNGELLHRPAARDLMQQAAREVGVLAQAQGIRIPFPDPGSAALEVAQKTATNFSSMLQDIRRGAPTEIEAICGAIARTGESLGIPTPVNRVLWQLVKAKTER